MKRIVTAFVIAVGIHGFILSLEFDRLKGDHFRKLRTEPVLMTLAYRQPKETTTSQPPSKAEFPKVETVPPPPNAAEPSPADESKIHDSDKIRPQPSLPAVQPEPASARSQPASDAIVPAEARLAETPATDQEAESLRPEAAMPQDNASDNAERTPLPATSLGTPEPEVRKARPLYLENPSPPYPRLARRRGYQGSVILEVMVLSDGTVGDLRIAVSSGHKILDQTAVAAVRKWQFEPGRLGSQKVDTWVRVPIRFELDR